MHLGDLHRIVNSDFWSGFQSWRGGGARVKESRGVQRWRWCVEEGGGEEDYGGPEEDGGPGRPPRCRPVLCILPHQVAALITHQGSFILSSVHLVFDSL